MSLPVDDRAPRDGYFEFLTGNTLDTKFSSLLIKGEKLVATFGIPEHGRSAFAVTTERIVLFEQSWAQVLPGEIARRSLIRSVPLSQVLELRLFVLAPEQTGEGETRPGATLEVLMHGIQSDYHQQPAQNSLNLYFDDLAEARRAHDLVFRELTRRGGRPNDDTG